MLCVCVHACVDVVQNENKNFRASPRKVCDENKKDFVSFIIVKLTL